MNKHNNGSWYEILALSTLQVVFPSEFLNLELSDQPDLIDSCSKTGIEVIHPTDEKQEMLTAYYFDHLYGNTMDQVSSIGLKKFQLNSCDVLLDPKDQTISSCKMPYKPFDIGMIYRAINKKLKKLNSNLYAYSDNCSLFLEMSMFTKELDDCSVARNILTYVKKAEPNYLLSFREIFLDCMMKLYRINLLHGKITEIETADLMDAIKQKYEENNI